MASWLKKYTESSLVLRILCGLIVGAVLGLTLPQWKGIGILGELFVNALKAIAPVLVAFLVASSISKAQGGLGPRFRTVISLYLTATLVAAAVAVAGSFMFPVTMSLQEGAQGSAPGPLTDIFKNLLGNMVMNPVSAIAKANYIGILFWAVILGFGLKLAAGEGTIKFIAEVADVLTLTVKWIIQFVPFGVLGLVFTAVSESGLEIFTVYGRLLLLLVGCMLVSVLVFNPLISFIATGRNPYPLLFTCLKESGLNAFFTRSSAANIPINMELCHKLGIEEDFYSVSIPLGATVNLNGAAVTITVMTLATANTLGIEVSFASALLLSVLATLGACGASGVAGGSLLLIPMACSLFGISNDIAMQTVAVGFIIGVIQDSVETAVNSSGDVFFTATAERRITKNKM